MFFSFCLYVPTRNFPLENREMQIKQHEAGITPLKGQERNEEKLSAFSETLLFLPAKTNQVTYNK